MAYSPNRVIGDTLSKGLLWHLSEDLKHFKRTTADNCLVMGRVTWDSLPIKPLPNRMNIVVTRQPKDVPVFYDPSEPYWANTLEDAIRIAKVSDVGKEIFIIGGAQIYQEALDKDLVDRVIASELNAEYYGDLCFPELLNWQGKIVQEFEEFKIVEYVKA